MAETHDYLFKLFLIGDFGVEKTCLLFRFSEDYFKSTFIATIGIDFKIRTTDTDGKKMKLKIWDTAGQERLRTITTVYYRGAMGIVLVYDVTNLGSFENIYLWMRNIDQHANQDVEKMPLGNECDAGDEMRQVTEERGAELANSYSIRFLETSAKSDASVEEASNHWRGISKSKWREKVDANSSPKQDLKNLSGDGSKRRLWRCSVL